MCCSSFWLNKKTFSTLKHEHLWHHHWSVWLWSIMKPGGCRFEYRLKWTETESWADQTDWLQIWIKFNGTESVRRNDVTRVTLNIYRWLTGKLLLWKQMFDECIHRCHWSQVRLQQWHHRKLTLFNAAGQRDEHRDTRYMTETTTASSHYHRWHKQLVNSMIYNNK